MAQTVADKTLFDYPGLFYHKVTDEKTIADMELLRQTSLMYGKYILAFCPDNRERGLAMTHLQTATMFAIASLAIDTGEIQVPPGFLPTFNPAINLDHGVGRDLGEVIGEILLHIPDDLRNVRDKLLSIASSYQFAPPEMIPFWWKKMADTLALHFGPAELDWQKKIQAIIKNTGSA